MTVDVELRSGPRSVSVTQGQRPDHYSVTIDGRSVEVHARRLGEHGLAVRTLDWAQQTGAASADKTNGGNHFTSEHAVRQVFVTALGGGGEVLVTFDGRTASVTLNGRRNRRPADAGAHAQGDQSVRAPMPGRVLRVLVAAGDEVAAGQGIVVVEAMKMENELRAPKAGRVKDVSVLAGASVDAGKVLVVIE